MSGESKQIDGVVDDPENGGLKSGPCLIAGFHALSCTSPSYYNPYRGVNKNTLSVDMVRLSLTFKGDRGEWLSRKGAQLTDCDEMSAWTAKSAKSSSFATRWAMKSSGSPRDWSPFGAEREQLRETLKSFDPSLPRLGAGKLRGALSAAQSSIQSLLDAQEQREQLERQLRSLETASGR